MILVCFEVYTCELCVNIFLSPLIMFVAHLLLQFVRIALHSQFCHGANVLFIIEFWYRDEDRIDSVPIRPKNARIS